MEYRRVVKELHAPARRNFPRRRIVIKGYDDLFQADLVEMIPYARENKGFRYILMVIDAYSKYLWAVPVKSKSGPDVAQAMSTVLQQRKPKNLQTDQGKEFFNIEFKRLTDRHNINHYTTYSHMKAAIVERVNRTIKEKMWKEFSFQGNHKWLDLLPQLIKEYNATIHRTTGMKPKEVTPKTKLDAYHHIKKTAPVHFKVGDHVRISKFKRHFAKGYLPNWTNEIFTISKVHLTNPTTYLLRDYRGDDITGGFYKEELQKVRYPDVYLIEKILRRKGNRVYVKWRGFGNEHNSWVDANKVLDN